MFGGVLVLSAILHATALRVQLDNAALDTVQRLARWAAPRAAVDDIVIVGIDEETDRLFPEPMALWHAHIGDALQAIAAGRPKLIALDVVFPHRSYDRLAPGLDAALVRGLVAAKQVAPLAVGLTLDAAGRARPVEGLLMAAAGPEAFGLAYMPVDPDGTARRMHPPVAHGGPSAPLLAQLIARGMGIAPRDGIIDFACGAPFTYLPLHDVLRWPGTNPQQLLRSFEGKVVLLGHVGPDSDPVRQPLSLAGWAPAASSPPGVVLLAQYARALRSDRIVQQLQGWPLAALIATGALPVLVAGLWRTWAVAWLLAAGLAALVYFAFLAGTFVPPLCPLFALGAGATMRSSFEAFRHRRDRLAIERQFGGYVSENLLQALLAGEIDPTQPTRHSNLAFLYADLRGFTTMAERLEPEEALARLNRYYEAITPAIHAFDGTIDNFRGDGILVIFGAPRAAADAARRAALATLAIFDQLARLNRELVQEGREPLQMGVGLAAGHAVVGNVGTATRHGYSAVGDAVNVAARLQALCKPLGMRVIATTQITQSCAELGLIPLGQLELAGHAPVEAFGMPASESRVPARPSQPVMGAHGAVVQSQC